MGLYGSKYVWILPSWYGKDWYKGGTHCHITSLLQVIEGALYVGPSFTNPILQKGIGGMDANDFHQEFLERNNMSEPYASEFGPSVYDGVWATAMALNITDHHLRVEGRYIHPLPTEYSI